MFKINENNRRDSGVSSDVLVYVSVEFTLRIIAQHDIAQVSGRPVLRRQMIERSV